jgi:uncharacterized membrane protein
MRAFAQRSNRALCHGHDTTPFSGLGRHFVWLGTRRLFRRHRISPAPALASHVQQLVSAELDRNFELNTLGDGAFHSVTYLFVVAGVFVLWQAAHRGHLYWSGKLMIGSMLIGFGLFNVAEGIVDHQILGVHHVNETVAAQNWIYWDIGFLLWGAAMIVGGWWLLKAGRRETDLIYRQPRAV